MKRMLAISIRTGLCGVAMTTLALTPINGCRANAVESTSLTASHPAASSSAPSSPTHTHAHDHPDHGDDHHHHHHPNSHGSSGHDHAHDHHHPSFDPNAPCVCPASGNARAQSEIGIWCRKCNVGHVAGIKIESAMLFETLDPHGHDIDVSTLHCRQCIAALAADGFCHACGTGFKGRQAYFTALTWGLARGAPVRDNGCRACASLAGSAGWCERCNRGVVGNIQIDDRKIFDPTAAELHALRSAIARVSACELCACAMVVHRTCPNCRISYATQSHHHH